MKKLGKEEENNKKDEIVNKTVNDVIDQVAPSGIDSSFEDDDKGPVFVEPEEDATMTLNKEELYQNRGMTAATLVEKKPGLGFQDTRDIQNPVPSTVQPKEKVARPATNIDLENLDESMIMDIPEIKAATYELIDMLNLKPKDRTLRFRWANFRNNVAGNLSVYLAKGFQVAHIEDVDQSTKVVDPSMIDGTQVKYLDILLLKVPVLRLMELYKANIVKSVNRLVKNRPRGLKEARRDFQDQLNAQGLGRDYNLAKAKLGGKEPVEFFTPGAEESELINS